MVVPLTVNRFTCNGNGNGWLLVVVVVWLVVQLVEIRALVGKGVVRGVDRGRRGAGAWDYFCRRLWEQKQVGVGVEGGWGQGRGGSDGRRGKGDGVVGDGGRVGGGGGLIMRWPMRWLDWAGRG